MSDELGLNNRTTYLSTTLEFVDVEKDYNIRNSKLTSNIEVDENSLYNKPISIIDFTHIEGQTEFSFKDLEYNNTISNLYVIADFYEESLAPETPLITETHIEAQTEFSSEELEFAIRTTVTNTNIEKDEPLLFNGPDSIVEFTHIEAQVEAYEAPLYKSFNIYAGRIGIVKIYLGYIDITDAMY